MNRHFSKDIDTANLKQCSTALITGETQIKTTRHHLTLVKVATKSQKVIDASRQGCREKGMLIHCWWKCKFIQPLWKAVWSIL